jgi:methionyl-tRNA synthetase
LDATKFDLFESLAIEKESTSFGPLINKKKYDAVLKDINQFMEEYPVFANVSVCMIG